MLMNTNMNLVMICIPCYIYCHIYPKYSDKTAWGNSVDPAQMLQTAASDQGPLCLPLITQFQYTYDM